MHKQGNERTFPIGAKAQRLVSKALGLWNRATVYELCMRYPFSLRSDTVGR